MYEIDAALVSNSRTPTLCNTFLKDGLSGYAGRDCVLEDGDLESNSICLVLHRR